MTSTKEGGEITKFGGMLRMVVDGILGGEMFLETYFVVNL